MSSLNSCLSSKAQETYCFVVGWGRVEMEQWSSHFLTFIFLAFLWLPLVLYPVSSLLSFVLFLQGQQVRNQKTRVLVTMNCVCQTMFPLLICRNNPGPYKLTHFRISICGSMNSLTMRTLLSFCTVVLILPQEYCTGLALIYNGGMKGVNPCWWAALTANTCWVGMDVLPNVSELSV